MKTEDVKVGETYFAKVSGRIVPVRVTVMHEAMRLPHGHKRRIRFSVVNLKTNRVLTMSAARLRPQVKRAVRSLEEQLKENPIARANAASWDNIPDRGVESDGQILGGHEYGGPSDSDCETDA